MFLIVRGLLRLLSILCSGASSNSYWCILLNSNKIVRNTTAICHFQNLNKALFKALFSIECDCKPFGPFR